MQTCLACDVRKQSENPETTLRRRSKGQMIGLNAHMAIVAYSATPRASDGEKGGPGMSFGAGGIPLPAQMYAAYSPTPCATDPHIRVEKYAQGGTPLSWALANHFGPTTNGSSAPSTGKRGVPNPAFPFWLMGFPAAWISGAYAAMRSRPSSRRK